MTSRIEDHCWITGIRWRALRGVLAVGTVLLSAVTATRSQQAPAHPTYTVLYSFAGGADGAYPYAGLVQDQAGNLYGTTAHGNVLTCDAPLGCGTVFKLDATGTETVLHRFTGGVDGVIPYAGLVRDKAGNLYGTTFSGGASNAGVVFKVDPTGTETVLHTFAGFPTDGATPYAGLVQDKPGNLYGTTFNGGASNVGVVFKVDPTGTETVLQSFTGGADSAFANPYAGLVEDKTGNLYGTTVYGGASTCFDGCGTVFRLDPTGTESVLYSFTGGADGANPYAGLVQDKAGNLYGTTYAGGASNVGVVFKVDPTGTETVLYSFTGGADGANPYAGLVQDKAGNLYGTTFSGGASNAGVVFKVDPTGTETVLYSFTGGADGANPYAGLVQDKAGNLYGTTFNGGASNVGVVFKLTP